MSDSNLDITFNNPLGYVIKQYGGSTTGFSVVIDNKKRIVVTGDTTDTDGEVSMFTTRYLADGKIDNDYFGGNITKLNTPGKNTVGRSVAIDSEYRIVVTGDMYDSDSGTNYNMFIARYLPNGNLDTSFAGGVITKQYTPGRDTSGISVAIDSDDSIVVTGYTVYDTDTDKRSMFITRYLSDGTLDNNFDGGVIFEQYTSGKDTSGQSVAIGINDTIVVTGATIDNNDIYSMFITRYLFNGQIDPNFGNNGVTKYTNNKFTGGFSVAIDSIGRIVVTGVTGESNIINSMFITRYSPDGKIDSSFSGGFITKEYTIGGINIGYSVAIDSIDRIVVTGTTGVFTGVFGNEDTVSMFITRYLPNGTLDTSFSGGFIIKQYIPGKPTGGFSVAIDSSNRIVVTGVTDDNTGTGSMFITRYLEYGNSEPICLPAGTPIVTDQGIVAIEQIDTKVHTINHRRIVAVTTTITPEKNLVCFEANSMGINCPSKRTTMTPGHEVLYNGKLVQAKHFVGRVEGVHTIPYNGKDVLYNVLQEKHGLMRVNNMVLETLHPENKVAKEILKKRYLQ
jgi:uncharacterized delta-60 repeat protein